MAKKGELESNVQELNERLDEEMENNATISSTRRKLEAEIDHLQENLEDLQTQMSGLAQEKAQKERDCQSLEGELEKVNDNLSRTHKEKKALEERVDVSYIYIYISTKQNSRDICCVCYLGNHQQLAS